MIRILAIALLFFSINTFGDYSWPEVYPSVGYQGPLFDKFGTTLVAFNNNRLLYIDLKNRKEVYASNEKLILRPQLSIDGKIVVFDKVINNHLGLQVLRYINGKVEPSYTEVNLKKYYWIDSFQISSESSWILGELGNPGEHHGDPNDLVVYDSLTLKEVSRVTASLISYKTGNVVECGECVITTEFERRGLFGVTTVKVRTLPDLKVLRSRELEVQNPGKDWYVAELSQAGNVVSFINRCGPNFNVGTCISVLNTKDFKTVLSFDPDDYSIDPRHWVAFSTNGNYFTYTNDIADHFAFDLTDLLSKKKYYEKMTGQDADRIVDFFYLGDSSEFITVNAGGRVTKIDSKNGNKVLIRELGKLIAGCSLSKDGKVLYTMDMGGTLDEWTLSTSPSFQ